MKTVAVYFLYLLIVVSQIILCVVDCNESYTFEAVGDGDAGHREDLEQFIEDHRAQLEAAARQELGRSEKIESALRNFLGAHYQLPDVSLQSLGAKLRQYGLRSLKGNYGEGRQMRLLVRSAESTPQLVLAEMGGKPESSLGPLELKAYPEEQQAVKQEQLRSVSDGTGSAGLQFPLDFHKTTRNVKAVAMRIPPRFGKRFHQ